MTAVRGFAGTLVLVEQAHLRELQLLRTSCERKVKEARASRDEWRETALRYQKELAEVRTALINTKRQQERTA